MGTRVHGLRTAGVAVVAVLVLASAALLAAHQPQPSPPAFRPPGGATDTGASAGISPVVGVAVPWWVLPVVLGLLLLLGSLLWFVFRDELLSFVDRRDADQQRRDAEHDRRTGDLEAFAERALGDALDDLAAEGDAREVVVACWVRIELAAEAEGLGRRPAETASDVARRWLGGSTDRAAVDALAALYHEARYSTHPMTAAHRDHARSTLRAVLRVPA